MSLRARAGSAARAPAHEGAHRMSASAACEFAWRGRGALRRVRAFATSRSAKISKVKRASPTVRGGVAPVPLPTATGVAGPLGVMSLCGVKTKTPSVCSNTEVRPLPRRLAPLLQVFVTQAARIRGSRVEYFSQSSRA